MAQAALDTLALDQVLFIPSFRPPHKVEFSIAPFAQRLAMLKLGLDGQPQFALSALEGERQGLSYTIDTLQQLQHRLGEEVSLFFLMGFDAFVEMATWKGFRDIPGLADIVVINRPQARQGSMAAAIHAVFGARGSSSQIRPGLWQLVDGGQIHELVMDEVPVSSTAIRQALALGRDVSSMLQPSVAAYIRGHGLYRER